MKKVLQRAMSFGVVLSMSLFFTSISFAQDMSDATSAALDRCREEANRSKDNVIEAAVSRFADSLAAEHPIAGSSGLSSFEGYGGSTFGSLIDYVSPLSSSFTDKFSSLTDGWEGVAMITDEFSAGVQKDVSDFDIGGRSFSCAAGLTMNTDGELNPHIGVYTRPYDDGIFYGVTAKPGFVGATVGWGF